MNKAKNAFFEYTNQEQIYGKINLGVGKRSKAQILNIRNKKEDAIELAEI